MASYLRRRVGHLKVGFVSASPILSMALKLYTTFPLYLVAYADSLRNGPIMIDNETCAVGYLPGKLLHPTIDPGFIRISSHR